MVELHNITITTKKDDRTLIQNLHLTLQTGDKIAIIGEEGNGKSTLLKLIYAEQMIAEYCIYEGNVWRNECSMGFLSQELSDEEKMILDQCEILILDEPTRNFSPLTTPVLCRALTAFEGVIISISHDRRYLHEVATTVYELTSDGPTKIK